jgi:hypothetical protein
MQETTTTKTAVEELKVWIAANLTALQATGARAIVGEYSQAIWVTGDRRRQPCLPRRREAIYRSSRARASVRFQKEMRSISPEIPEPNATRYQKRYDQIQHHG